MTLLIDDIRDYRADVIARNATYGIKILVLFDVDYLMLDHDLGNDVDGTGYTIACYLEAHPDRLPDVIELVTSNPVGRERMAAVFSKLYPYSQMNRIFSKRPIE